MSLADIRRTASVFAARRFVDVIDSTPAPRRKVSAISAGDMVVTGFVGETLGIGSAARMTCAGLEREGYAVLRDDLGKIRESPLVRRFNLPGANGVWICHCNPPEYERLRLGLSTAAIAGRFRIGYWAWELETLPDRWVRAARHFHEIWAPSKFVAGAVERSVARDPARFGRPIVRIAPHPIGRLTPNPGFRQALGLGTGQFVVLMMFDLRSSRSRKNPDGGLAAFKEAFPTPGADTVLICKVLAADAFPAEMETLRRAVSDRPDVRLLTETFDDHAVTGLMSSADVFLSLHRSEGYGLAIAEAMHLGKAVVATGWSGNMDFMGQDCAAVVPFELKPVHDPQGIYETGGRWAEPNVTVAADWLRRLRHDDAERRRLGEAARSRIVRHEEQFAELVGKAPWRDLAPHGL